MDDRTCLVGRCVYLERERNSAIQPVVTIRLTRSYWCVGAAPFCFSSLILGDDNWAVYHSGKPAACRAPISLVRGDLVWTTHAPAETIGLSFLSCPSPSADEMPFCHVHPPFVCVCVCLSWRGVSILTRDKPRWVNSNSHQQSSPDGRPSAGTYRSTPNRWTDGRPKGSFRAGTAFAPNVSYVVGKSSSNANETLLQSCRKIIDFEKVSRQPALPLWTLKEPTAPRVDRPWLLGSVLTWRRERLTICWCGSSHTFGSTACRRRFWLQQQTAAMTITITTTKKLRTVNHKNHKNNHKNKNNHNVNHNHKNNNNNMSYTF